MTIRDVRSSDVPAILALNEANTVETSALDADRLDVISSGACYFKVFSEAGEIDGFLLALGNDAAYENENFEWFRARYPSFIYIDRVIVRRDRRKARIASRLYDDLELTARDANVGLFACEVNIEPPNDASLAFHRGRGFVEVGSRAYGALGKTVSFQVKALRPSGAESVEITPREFH